MKTQLQKPSSRMARYSQELAGQKGPGLNSQFFQARETDKGERVEIAAMLRSMARRPRIQFAGALYHIINRGNYRRDIFETEGAAQAFEKCLFETCEKSGWRLHAYVIMRNHFHLAVETPQGNLVKGMHWLQGTFATRFNRFRSEQGYLFQRRYQAILVEPGPTLSYVVNYIHLNPVKCGLLTVDRMDEYRWCSFRRFVQKNRPAFLVCEEWLAELGRFSDSRAGWRSYRDYLSWLITDKPEQKNQAFEQMTRGWALGSKEFRVDLIKAHKENLENKHWEEAALEDLNEQLWNEKLKSLLEKAGKRPADALCDRKSAAWKIPIAYELRRRTSASNSWIARALHMGKPGSVSAYVATYRQTRKI